MKPDKETVPQLQDQPSESGGGANHSFQRQATLTALTPPPPSAPSEFLTAQWVDATGRDGIRPPVDPPPPSAPSEFLSAQWRAGKPTESEPAKTETDVFAEALPERVERAEDLEGTLELEPPPSAEEDERRQADTGPAVRIRGLPLGQEEEIAQVFLPNEGLAGAVPRTGQALILTNRRLIAFRGVEGFRDTHFALTSEISQCSVRTGQRNWGAILQGFMIMVGGAFLYLVVGYWLAGRISGPNVPVLNMDVAPFIALLIILAGLLVLLQNYFTRPAGAVIFHGEGVEIAFPFRSSLDLSQVYEFVDMTHAAGRTVASDATEKSTPSQSGG